MVNRLIILGTKKKYLTLIFFIFIKLITDLREIERFIKIKSDIKHGSRINFIYVALITFHMTV